MKLSTNCFSKPILNDFDAFKWEITESKDAKLNFKWSWCEYEGFGEIEYIDGRVCNSIGNNFSYLTLSAQCRDKHSDIKPSCCLYNDSGLEDIFNHILNIHNQAK